MIHTNNYTKNSAWNILVVAELLWIWSEESKHSSKKTKKQLIGTIKTMQRTRTPEFGSFWHIPTNFWLLQLSSSHSGLTMCLTTDMAVRNLTVRVTLLATRWVTFWLLSATSPPNACNLWETGEDKHNRRQPWSWCWHSKQEYLITWQH